MKLPTFYPILDTAVLERAGLGLVAAAEALLEAGAGILQLRHKGHFDRQTYAAAREIARVCGQALFVVNDRADVARLLGAGLHVGQDDLAPRDARLVLGDLPLGFSTHNPSQLSAAESEPVDYVAIGPIFGTQSKANPDPVVGLDTLRPIRSSRPLVAIGGITRSTALSVLQAGADSVAIIGDLYPTECNPRTLRERAEEWIRLTNGNRN